MLQELCLPATQHNEFLLSSAFAARRDWPAWKMLGKLSDVVAAGWGLMNLERMLQTREDEDGAMSGAAHGAIQPS